MNTESNAAGREANAEWRERAAEQREHRAEDHILASESVMRRVIREELYDAFIAIGLDPKTPLENQKKMAFLSMLHNAWTKGGMKMFLTLVGVITLAGLIALLMGLGVPAKALAIFGVKGS